MVDRRTVLKSAAATAAIAIAGGSSRLWAQGAPVTVRSTQAAPGLSFAPVYVANKRGLWAKNGVTHETKLVQGGPLAMVTLQNQAAEFISTASSDPLVAWDKGIKTLVIAAYTGGLVMQFTARKDWMEKTGIGPKSPLDAKVKAIAQARLGVSTIGGGPALYRHLASLHGIAPESLKLTAIGLGPARMAALRENQVDLSAGSAPEADQVTLAGFGELFLDCAGEVPLYREFPYTVAMVRPEIAAQQPDMVRRIGRTLAEANDFIHSNFGATVDLLKAEFPQIDPRAIERTMERDRAAYPKGARMNAKMWENGYRVAADLKMVTNVPPVAEGEFWTNKFLA